VTVASRVLVVDDDEVVRELVRVGLEEAGHEVVVAEDGHDALRRLESTPCDLVLTDVQMPRLDGFQLTEALRASPSTRDLPIVLMTAHSVPGQAVHGLRLGADDYVRKPFDLHELVARVNTRLERPPLPMPGLTEARRVGVMTPDGIARELEREVHRATESGRAFAVAVLYFAEHATIVDRFGRVAGVDVLRMAAQVAQSAAAPLDLAGLAPTWSEGHRGGLVLLMPETQPDQVEQRLSAVTSALAVTPFAVGDESVHVTPVAGWATITDRPAADDAEQLLHRARTAAMTAEARLDLVPLRWTAALEEALAASPRPRRRRVSERLRTPAQILLTLLLGVAVPFAAYVGLYRLGVDISGGLYLVVSLSLAITAALIWIEGFLALRPPLPPAEPAATYPPASAIIAAYLPNEAATVLETIEHFLAVDYPVPLQIVLAYNTPYPMPVEDRLTDLARRDHRFVPFRVEGSTSKAQNVNAALAVVQGEFTGIFDADHHPRPDSFVRAWRWLSNGYDVVQGHCVIRNGEASFVARTVAVEFEAIYAVSHPGRTRLHGFGIFGGSNGYWRTDALREFRMHGGMLTEDIDSSMRALMRGRRIASDPGLVGMELAPTTVKAIWNQRMRWAQGWFQVSRRHLVDGWRSRQLTLRNKLGMFFLLGWREAHPWLSLQMYPLIGFLAWREAGVANLSWVIPVFVLLTLFTLSVGPGQVVFAYRLAHQDLRRRSGWFITYLLVASLLYTEFKNIISRVAQIKEVLGDRRWVVTPRATSATAGARESSFV
jgi:DNA-binding response OmpR family regulator/cellulose synthase/poly-beta-1,6-N-acetylglucosamine synthase-like glycosyltransferase